MTTPADPTPLSADAIDAEYERLSTLGPTLAVLTNSTYGQTLDYRWAPYARTRGLPTDFAGPDARALTLPEVEAVIAAGATGELRRGTRDGAHDRSGQPMAVDSVRVLLSALRHAHRVHGLGWLDEVGQGRVADLMSGYERTYGVPKTAALAMEPGHLRALFGSVPWTDPPAVLLGCALRALSLDTGIAMTELFDAGVGSALSAEEPLQLVGSFGTRTIDCTAIASEPATAAVCPHCLLVNSDLDPRTRVLVPRRPTGAGPDLRAAVTRSAKAAAALVPGAQMGRMTLTLPAPATLAQRLALLAPPAALGWLTARALCLAQMAVGLREDDLARLEPPQTRIGQEILTLGVRGKHSNGESTVFTLTATGGQLCPVNAVGLYDQYVRVFLPDRGRLFVPLNGKIVKHPVEKDYDPASRALYQCLRLWLVSADERLGLSALAPAGARTHLTPHSARRGFATLAYAQGKTLEQVQKALRHARPDTTMKYLDAGPEPITDLLGDIAGEPTP